MDPRLQGLSAQLALHSKLFLNCLDGISDEDAGVRAGGTTNSMAFLAAHLVDSRHWLARITGLMIDNPFGPRLDGARGIEDLKDCPTVEESRRAWRPSPGRSRRTSSHSMPRCSTSSRRRAFRLVTSRSSARSPS